ncbi:MAG: hypothetical protein GY822_21505 [Deltaproteobacteria bacterium]|nr:hypothetical protein [Deltaproteobacteria bacterium]
MASDDFSSFVQKKYPLHVHTNDAPILDFMFSRWVGSGLQPSIDFFRAAKVVNAQRPPVAGGVDWRGVGIARHRMAAYATHSLFEGNAADSSLQGSERAHLTVLGQRSFQTDSSTLSAFPEPRLGSIHDLWRTVFWTYSASLPDADKLESRWRRLRTDFPAEVKIMEPELPCSNSKTTLPCILPKRLKRIRGLLSILIGSCGFSILIRWPP